MTAKKLGGLGRGLGAIYDDFDVSGLSEEDGDDKRLETVKLDELRPGSTQPRSTSSAFVPRRTRTCASWRFCA